MKRNSRNFCTWLLITAMILSTLVMQFPFAKQASAATEQISQSLTKVLNYYKDNNYSNATSWWDLVGLWGAGDDKKTDWDSSKTDLNGNILGTLAKGEDPSNTLGSRNLLAELKETQDSNTGSFNPSVNNHIWAIVALDAAKSQYDQEKAVSYLLEHQNQDGGFYYSADWNSSDPDLTGMALLALANHQASEGVTGAIEKVKAYIKGIQQDTGGFVSWGTDNPNSVATIISGLVAVGEDPLDDSWIKNGKTMLDDLLSFQLDDGSISTPYNPGQADPMATYQSLVALGDLKANKSVWQRLQEISPETNSSVISPVTAKFDKKSSKQANIPVTITLNGNTLNMISNKGTALKAGSDYDVADEGSKITIKKGYLTKQKIGTTILDFIFSAGNSGTLTITVFNSSSGGGGTETGSIKLAIYGKNKHVILASTNVTLESGATPYSVLAETLGEDNVTVSNSFVSGINGLNSGDDGPLSGWMYSVNGKYLQVSAFSKTLSDGDRVVWRYTTNMGKDIGADMGGSGGGSGTSTDSEVTQSNQEVLAELNDVTAQQQAEAGLPENTPAVSPDTAGQVVLKAADGVQLTVPPGAIRDQSTPVKFIVEIGKVTTPPKTDTDVRVISPLKYQRRFGIENSASAVQEDSIQEDSVQFSAPIVLSIPIVVEDLPNGINAQQLAIYWWDLAKNDWVKLGGVFDQVTKTISVPVYHFSTYAVIADITGVPKRLAGPDRFQTANAVAVQGWKAGADNVVLVNAYAFSDALAAVPLAFKLNAPILLTESETLAPSILEQIQNMKPKKITLIGGTSLISQAIQDELEKVYGADNVLRYGGSDRYSTAALIAAALGTNGKAIIANGGEDHYADALAVSSYAAYNGIPILFTERTVLPDSTIQALTTQKVTSTIVVGGSFVVPEEITKRLPEGVRYGGSDSYATAVAVAEGLKLNANQVYVVTGLNFADALTAGNLAAHTSSPVIMVDSTIPEASSSYLTVHKESVSDLVIVGGEGVINADQENTLRTICQ
ncbi:MAG: cell wall-binding repeat-containing protein [Desulfitobacteriaceae bacterium]